jgi:hypothetical protein
MIVEFWAGVVDVIVVCVDVVVDGVWVETIDVLDVVVVGAVVLLVGFVNCRPSCPV